MGKKRCADKDPPPPIPFVPIHIIHKILVWQPVVSLLRFKLVCKSWSALIQTSIDLHTTNTTTSKFGSFILHAVAAVVDFEERFIRENAVFMLSSLSVSESESSKCCVSRSGSWYSGSCGSWSTTAYYGICGRCDSGSAYRRISVCREDCCENRKWSPVTNYLGGPPPQPPSDNDNNDDPLQQQQLVLKLDNLGFPSCYQFDRMMIIKPPPPILMVVGSCNGLICLYAAQQPNQLLQVSLWNPATKQFRILPKPITITAGNGGGDVHRLFAFGYDAETKDYKVVLLSVFNRRMILNYELAPLECVCRVQVYSLSTNSWKLLKGITSLPGSPFPYPPDYSSSSSELFYLNGSCFFMAKLLYSSSSSSSEEEEEPPRNRDRFIISFDLTTEIITPIELPSHHYREHLYLCYLGKKIALFAKIYVYTNVYDVNDPNGSWEAFRISVFNEHRSSWTQVHGFLIRLGLPGERNIPRGISNDGVFALLETEIRGGLGNKKNKKKMRLYNLVTNQVKKNFLFCDQVLSKAYAYNPSLVSITGPSPVSSIVEAEDDINGDWKGGGC